MSNYQIVIIANRKPVELYYCFDEFFRSLRGVIPLLLGSGQGEYGGLGSKPRLLYNAIKGGAIKTSHIIFCDCFDLVFATHPDELFDIYGVYNSPFVISSEKNCFPADLKDKYDALAPDEPYRYLNSGMIVAEVGAMEAVLESMGAKDIPNDYWDEEKKCMINPNDQEYYQKEFLKQPVQMDLDYHQILCNTLHSVTIDELDFSRERISNTNFGTYPCSFHLNGSAKTDGLREPILKHLNLL